MNLLTIGDPAPDVALLDHQGTVRRISDYRGRYVILWFYPRANTPG